MCYNRFRSHPYLLITWQVVSNISQKFFLEQRAPSANTESSLPKKGTELAHDTHEIHQVATATAIVLGWGRDDLVVSTYPEKWWASSAGMMKFPTEWKKMFQTTNHVYI